MPGKPLLIFPLPSTTVREKEIPRFGTASYHFPDFQNQKDRLTPQFESMLQSFIADTADGLEPENVLVIETVGELDDFQRAVRAIPGLEWLAEIDEEAIEPDDNFYQKSCKIGKTLFSKKIKSINRKQSSQIWKLLLENAFINSHGYLTDKDINEFAQFIPADFSEHSKEIIKSIKDESTGSHKQLLSGRLFLSMSNKQAIDKLLSLWKQWDSGDKKLVALSSGDLRKALHLCMSCIKTVVVIGESNLGNVQCPGITPLTHIYPHINRSHYSFYSTCRLAG